MFCIAKSAKIQTFFGRWCYTFSKQKCSNLRPLLFITFPQGLGISKNFRHPTLGSGGKKTFKQYLKSEQTYTHTDRHTDISTCRKHRPRELMLWKSILYFCNEITYKNISDLLSFFLLQDFTIFEVIVSPWRKIWFLINLFLLVYL